MMWLTARGLKILLAVAVQEPIGFEARLVRRRDAARRAATLTQGRKRVLKAAEQRNLEIALHQERKRPLKVRMREALEEE